MSVTFDQRKFLGGSTSTPAGVGPGLYDLAAAYDALAASSKNAASSSFLSKSSKNNQRNYVVGPGAYEASSGFGATVGGTAAFRGPPRGAAVGRDAALRGRDDRVGGPRPRLGRAAPRRADGAAAAGARLRVDAARDGAVDPDRDAGVGLRGGRVGPPPAAAAGKDARRAARAWRLSRRRARDAAARARHRLWRRLGARAEADRLDHHRGGRAPDGRPPQHDEQPVAGDAAAVVGLRTRHHPRRATRRPPVSTRTRRARRRARRRPASARRCRWGRVCQRRFSSMALGAMGPRGK